MSGNPGRHLPWRDLIVVCAVAAAAAGGLITWRAVRPARLPHASCGSAVTHLLDASTQALSADPGALGCFSAAARKCSPASIEITELGVDAGTSSVFTIGPGGTRCQVTGTSQGYSANFGGSAGPVTSVSCRLTAVTGKGVMLGCGGPDVLIPASVSTPRPVSASRSPSS